MAAHGPIAGADTCRVASQRPHRGRRSVYGPIVKRRVPAVVVPPSQARGAHEPFWEHAIMRGSAPTLARPKTNTSLSANKKTQERLPEFLKAIAILVFCTCVSRRRVPEVAVPPSQARGGHEPFWEHAAMPGSAPALARPRTNDSLGAKKKSHERIPEC